MNAFGDAQSARDAFGELRFARAQVAGEADDRAAGCAACGPRLRRAPAFPQGYAKCS